MKVLSVVGFTQSGKTTTIEAIIRELKRRRYSVGSVKDIHFEAFQMDDEGTNSYRHKEAGAQLVTARGLNETNILLQYHEDIYKILRFYDHDYVILEGVAEGNFPKLIAAKDEEGIEGKLDHKALLITGKIADHIETYKGLPAMSGLKDIEGLVDFIEEKVPEMLPHFDKNCCGICGMSCEQMLVEIMNDRKAREDCLLNSKNIKLDIDGQSIDMVPFVQDILRNNVLAIVKELDGYKKDSKITIELGSSYD